MIIAVRSRQPHARFCTMNKPMDLAITSIGLSDARPRQQRIKPIYHKRTASADSHTYGRSSSPGTRKVRLARRRHSTRSLPEIVRFAEMKTSPTNSTVRPYPAYGRTNRMIQERRALLTRSDTLLPPRRLLSSLKRQKRDNPAASLATAATRNNAQANALLPQSSTTVRHGLSKPQWRKWHRSNSCDTIASEDPRDHGVSTPQAPNISPACNTRCARPVVNGNVCEYYYRYPFCCWISCLVFALVLLVAMVMYLGLTSI